MKSTVYSQLLETQKAEAAKLGSENADDRLAAGTYLAPAGFDANRYRFEAGRPLTLPTPIAGSSTANGNTITVNGGMNFSLPAGTPREQAEEIVRQLQGIAGSQGYTPDQWSRATVQ